MTPIEIHPDKVIEKVLERIKDYLNYDQLPHAIQIDLEESFFSKVRADFDKQVVTEDMIINDVSDKIIMNMTQQMRFAKQLLKTIGGQDND